MPIVASRLAGKIIACLRERVRGAGGTARAAHTIPAMQFR
jgi:hypothetical protein